MNIGQLGANQLLFINRPLDTWLPQARGSSARVFEGNLQNGSSYKPVAVKVMRPDKADYALPMFREEVLILKRLQEVSGVMRMLACGFIVSSQPIHLPSDGTQQGARTLAGKVTLYPPDETDKFFVELDYRSKVDHENIAREGWVSNWIPYLAAPIRPKEDNLLLQCDPGYTGGKFMPVKKALEIAARICEILQQAHEDHIVYRDHKVLHYYWSEQPRPRLDVIDWNVAKYHPQGLSEQEIQHDLVEFGARTLHYLLTGRAAPGALQLGPTRPQDIEKAPAHYEVKWQYDDRRLPENVKKIISDVLAGSFLSASHLNQEICNLMQELH